MTTLTEAHRQAQLRLGVRLVALLHSAFKLLDPEDLDGSFEDWLLVVEPLVQNGRRTSAQIAGAYLTASRLDAIGFDPAFAPAFAGPASRQALRTSLMVTGPVSIKAAVGRGRLLDEAWDIAEAGSSASAMRHALDGGRETILETFRRDDRTVGWQRVASARACDYCAGLAADGVVFGDDDVFESHDGCSCSAEPVYR